MRVVVLTNQSARGVVIIEALARAGIHTSAIVVDTDKVSLSGQVSKAKRIVTTRGMTETIYRTRRKVQRLLSRRQRQLGPAFYRTFSETMVEVPDANSQECEDVLKSLAPDIIVLGGARILKDHILRIPSVGVLNPHPGLLPEYRGVDVIPWAIHNGDPLGVTVHFVDPGIDTGDIVAQRRVGIEPGDTLKSLGRRADAMLGKLMAEVLTGFHITGQIERRPQASKGRLYSLMPAHLKAEVKVKLESASKGHSQRGEKRMLPRGGHGHQ